MPKTYKNQNYASLKKSCVSRGTLFEDAEFPASTKSLFHSKVETDIVWLRPKEICRVPKLVVDGVSSDDLVCDDVGRAWFATACMALAREPKLWQKVVPDHTKQEWDDTNKYGGIFRFSLWRYGEWVEVVVDDRLPTRDGHLVYCRSSAKNEFWSALLEKAYAKLFGDYESMAEGQAGEALVDFTGGVAEKIDFKAGRYSDPVMKKLVFSKMKEAFEDTALINAYIRTNPTFVGSAGPNGLINGLGYNVTMVKEIDVKPHLRKKLGTNNLRLVRLFSPGIGSKWTGAFSPTSSHMTQVPTAEWEKMGVKYAKEEEFWMSYQDFSTIFTNLNICHLFNTSFFSIKKSWTECVLQSEFGQSGMGGGNRWESDTVLRNPQIMFDISSEKDTAIVSLEQRDVQEDGISDISNFNEIGMYIMKVEENRKFRVHLKGEKVYQSEFEKSRSSFAQVDLEKGRYVVVPCCVKTSAVRPFLYRMYTKHNASTVSNACCWELKKECPDSGCCKPVYKLVTNIEVTKADGLALPEPQKGAINPFVVIICEGNKVTSATKTNTASPEFNVKATFYRKKPETNIVVQVFTQHRLFKTFLGEARVDIPDKGPDQPQGGETGTSKVFDLFGKKKEADIKKPGKLFVFMRSSYDLAVL